MEKKENEQVEAEETLSDTEIESLKARLGQVLKSSNPKHQWKIKRTIDSIPMKCKLDQVSKDHAALKRQHSKKFHPVRPNRGEIYNVLLSGDNVGTELNNNHLCVVISNQKKNIYSEKVNVVPIEGDGSKIDRMNNVQITNNDLEEGRLDKDPSKAIGGDVMTIDKARLDIKIGTLKTEKLNELMEMVKMQLGL